MLTRTLPRRLTRMAAIGLLVTGVAACDDDPVEPPEEEITQVTLTVGSVSGTSISMQPPATTMSVPRGTHNVTVSARGEQTVNFDLSEFELRITNATAGLTFTRTGPLTGTIAVPNAGSFSFRLALFHIEEEHEDYVVQTWPLTVTQ